MTTPDSRLLSDERLAEIHNTTGVNPNGHIVELLAHIEAQAEQLEATTALAKRLAVDLTDCISEVEGKAYLKDYVKACYDETLAEAREAGLLL